MTSHWLVKRGDCAVAVRTMTSLLGENDFTADRSLNPFLNSLSLIKCHFLTLNSSRPWKLRDQPMPGSFPARLLLGGEEPLERAWGQFNELFYLAGLISFIYQLSLEVSLVKMPLKRSIASFYGFIKTTPSTHWKWDRNGRRRSWGKRTDGNGVSNFIFSPPPLLSRLAAAACFILKV